MLLNLDKFKENLFTISLVLLTLNGAKTLILKDFFVRGVFIDFISPIIYLNYIIIFLIVVFLIKELHKKDWLLIFSILLFLFLNVLFSLYPLVSVTYIAKNLIYLPYLLILIRVKPKISYKPIFIINVVYIFVFLAQFITKNSFFPYLPFGFYYFNGLMPNMDYINFLGTKFVAPPANFPHPNLFAAFLSFLNIYNLRKSYLLFFINFLIIALLGSLAGLVFNTVVLFYAKKPLFKGLIVKFIFLTFILITFTYFFYFQYKPVSVIQRLDQLHISVFLILKYPFTGVGVANFVPAITQFEVVEKRIFTLQPVHNIFLLYFVEFGLAGIFYLFYFIKKYKSYITLTPFLIFLLVFGSFDHFLLTLNQGIILAALTVFAHVYIINTND